MRTWMAVRASTTWLLGVVRRTCNVSELPLGFVAGTRIDSVGEFIVMATALPLGNVIWLVTRCNTDQPCRAGER